MENFELWFEEPLSLEEQEITNADRTSIMTHAFVRLKEYPNLEDFFGARYLMGVLYRYLQKPTLADVLDEIEIRGELIDWLTKLKIQIEQAKKDTEITIDTPPMLELATTYPHRDKESIISLAKQISAELQSWLQDIADYIYENF